ncbi:MAG: MarR family transcriptional regulator [Chloroflexota bacterium]|nr:MarR family transcriptional regulator [Chloroflexota bacterium]
MSLSDKEYLQINQALFSLTHTYESRMIRDGALDSSGLALSDRSVLMVLGQFAPVNSRQLSRIMDINPGTISVYVHRLVEKGLIQKEQDQDDRRNWWLNLTEAGRAAYQETIAGAVAYTRGFLSALDETEQQALHRLLLKASHSLGFEWQ